MSKREAAAALAGRHIDVFQCPICSAKMEMVGSASLICLSNHTFDFAKQGYLNFMTRPTHSKYDKELFEARRKLVTESTFFDPLIHTLVAVLKNTTRDPLVLDTGCGEGSIFAAVCGLFTQTAGAQVTGFGIDISKEGIIAASKHDGNRMWAVADLAAAPFKDRQFDVILNILSPSNYREFIRLLADDGRLIKVFPQSHYLSELRAFLFDDPRKKLYSNEDTVARFLEYFQLMDQQRLSYSVKLNQASIRSLLRMTPLAWSGVEQKVNSFLERDEAEITIDLDILVGQPIKN